MKKYIYLVLILNFLLIGCTKSTNDSQVNPLPDGMVRMTLVLDFPQFKRPLTRNGMADENSIGHLWALIYKQSGGDWILDEAIEPRFEVNGTQANAVLDVRETTDNVRIVMLANAPSTILDDNGNATSFQSALSLVRNYAKLATVMQTTLLPQPLSSIPYTPNEMIPMSGQLDVAGISPGSSVSTEALQLKRIVAKITVSNQVTEDFTLSTVTVCNTPSLGKLFEGSIISPLVDGLTNYQEVATTDVDTRQNPIYIYESHPDNRTAVIVGGQYKGQTCYYKLMMRDQYGENLEIPANEYRRNYSYNFRISSVKDVGYKSLDEAISGALSNNEMIASVDAIDLSSHDIVDNGEYFLGLSNSEFHIYASSELNNLPVTTVSYTEGYGSVSVEIEDNLTGATLNSTLYSAGSDIMMSFPADFNSCKLRIRYGNLTKTLSIKREHLFSVGDPSIAIASYDMYSANEHIYAKIESLTGSGWIGLSASDDVSTLGVSELTNSKGGIYVKVRNNIFTSGAIMREATLYMSRHSSLGRLKVYLQQDFLNTGNIEDEERALPQGFSPVVGAFWKSDQIGERLIRIERPQQGSIDGYWYATVIQYGDGWDLATGDGVVMDMRMTKDRA